MLYLRSSKNCRGGKEDVSGFAQESPALCPGQTGVWGLAGNAPWAVGWLGERAWGAPSWGGASCFILKSCSIIRGRRISLLGIDEFIPMGKDRASEFVLIKMPQAWLALKPH